MTCVSTKIHALNHQATAKAISKTVKAPMWLTSCTLRIYCSPFGCADRVLKQFSTVCVGFIISTAQFYFTFSFPHTIFEYMYFLYAPNFVVCVCMHMCRTLKRCAWPFHCLYYHSIRWRVSVQMYTKHFEKIALILSSIQFVQRSNGITRSNCTHGFVWCVWYFTFKSTFILSSACLFFVCFFLLLLLLLSI